MVKIAPEFLPNLPFVKSYPKGVDPISPGLICVSSPTREYCHISHFSRGFEELLEVANFFQWNSPTWTVMSGKMPFSKLSAHFQITYWTLE